MSKEAITTCHVDVVDQVIDHFNQLCLCVSSRVFTWRVYPFSTCAIYADILFPSTLERSGDDVSHALFELFVWDISVQGREVVRCDIANVFSLVTLFDQLMDFGRVVDYPIAIYTTTLVYLTCSISVV